MDRPRLRVSVTTSDAGPVIHLAGELDTTTVDQLHAAVRDLLREPPDRITIDLAELAFCDSRGLGSLVVLTRTTRVQGTLLALRSPTPSFDRLLDVTGVRQALVIARPESS